LKGEWEVTCDDQKVNIGPRDTFSAPKNSIRSIKQVSDEEGSVFLIRQKN
jgi:quercetin dioxygenase-like cupin family protein